MKKRLALLLLFSLLAFVLAGCGGGRGEALPASGPEEATAPTPIPTPVTPDFDPEDLHPLLWRVSDDGGHTLYLFGTIHVGDGRNPLVLEKLAPILTSCDALAVEFDLVAYEQDLSAAVADYQQFVYQDGSSVRDHMPEELYERCVALLTEASAYSPLLDRYNLGMWSQLTETAALLTRSSLDPNFAMDRLLIQRAYDEGIPVLSVESASFQMGLLNSFPDELNLLLMEETLDGLDGYGEEIDALYAAWLAGDAGDLERLVLGEEDADAGDFDEEQLAMIEAYNRAMLDQRNLGMARTALAYLAGGDTVFLAVGAGHMLGESGLVRLLSSAGCTVEPVTP